MQKFFCSCFICRSNIVRKENLYNLGCDCPHGAPACDRCKSMAGQRSFVGAMVCRHCSNSKGDSICEHAKPLKCRVCSKSGLIRNPRLYFCDSLQAWRSLQENQYLRRRSAFFAMMAEDWRMFSSFYYQNFLLMKMVNPWTAEKKKAFFELWLKSQRRFLLYPQRMIRFSCNLWESYPHSPLFISRRFSWRFLQLPWSRLLVCKMSALPNSKWKIMNVIIQYLMAQHAEICEITF